MTKQEFIDQIAVYVKKYAGKYNIACYSAVIAQACLESAYGTSYKAGFHNYFGLKYRNNRVNCNNGYFEDGGSEQGANGSYTQLPSSTAWYRFDNMEKGVEGYFQFINISNYSNLKGVTDPNTYLTNIKADNYATSKDYVKNVMNVVNTWNLTKYDPITNTKKSSSSNKVVQSSTASKSTVSTSQSSIDINIPSSNINKVYKVAIDAGHGSNTSGKRAPDGYREHFSNAYICYYLDQILSKNGIKTLKTGWNDNNVLDDEDTALNIRQTLIRNAKCDISVSVHANASGNGNTYNDANGIETLYHTTDYGDSSKLASLIQNQLIKGTQQANRKTKQSQLAMCNCTALGVKAAVLVEVAFMTNVREAALLKSDKYCIECAREIAQGIFNYLGINGNSNIGLVSAINNSTTSATNSKAYELKNITLYRTSVDTEGVIRTGTYYLWSNEVINNRCKVTDEIGKIGVPGKVCGWVDKNILV